MPKKLVCVFGSEFYGDHARLLVASMVRNEAEQLVRFFQAETPLIDEPEPPKPTGIKGKFQRKPLVIKKAPTLPPYTKAVSAAYGFINEQYQLDDEVVLFAVTGTQYDWPVLYAAARVLAEHLEEGTEPPRVAPDPGPAVERERDVFGDRPLKETPQNILGKRIGSSVAIVYRSTSPITEINNALLEEFPSSVKHIFSFNWAVGHENYCNSLRDEAGQVMSREVCHFKNIQWHIPAVINATMGFIRYQSKSTDPWRSIKPSTPRTLTSVPTPLVPECPSSPVISSPTPARKSRFTWRFGSKQPEKPAPRSTTLPNERTAQRSSTLMSGYTTTRRSETLTSSFTTSSFATLVSSPSPMAPTASPFASTSSSGSSPDSSRSPRTSTALSQSSSTSTDYLSLREAYVSLPGMTKHQVWTYPAFRAIKADDALPERVIWRSSRE